MSLYGAWQSYIEENSKTQEQQNEFWEKYCLDEQVLYQKILGNKIKTIEGKFKDLAQENKMLDPQFMGFLDGINESIEVPLNLDEITLDSEISFEIDFSKLYKNMLAVPAEWLYTLDEWDNILTVDERIQLEKEYKRSKIVVNENKVGRNDPCSCGSGKKYKKCCGR